MSVHVLLNLLNELGKIYTMWGLPKEKQHWKQVDREK